ncbi:MAG: UDP-3-O-(3-hydroxymyristoyl)glucosamine N-acyltransferase [Rhodospirillales bacterium]|nr:UDP-3-O-(3-hydroxymyristoyl)glucosamine N-acyltransferase [Rhodospirillales bacterium]MCW8861851.1 UDP-3-O-(3-hydroxymyristoyl)glucosamine N-acyltransferase [Rhodospirillales bacterium]MCW8953166.1 UDP-3-O-(3-hydroxymyristoyl)glucosamine N-acyltransferase [Rhodospirillales bacterium]MCW8969637.1 UDP-3-O-(3-hydroxymyristoyl)glucosamine N-acyltransferase [Rhodospirillales bacterium]MCW9003169.1 UDP-3-O-(3-hydroxymyristoyl)glucosamine N-acyltransferase [Rhodospirillales bacterium]
MADPRFFLRAGPFSLDELAAVAEAELSRGDGARMFSDVSPLGGAGADHVSFLDNKKYVSEFMASSAGACVVHPDLASRAPEGMDLLLSPDPYRAYARIAAAFYPFPKPEAGISEGAVVADSAKTGDGCRIEPGAVIMDNAVIGRGNWIGANAVIGSGVVLGDDVIVGPGATLSHCIVGSRVMIHPGVRIGQDGFGFAMGPQGHLKVPQIGRVIVGNDVEIGANTTIDRGTGPDTIIGDGCKIDNLVQIAHNVQLGRGCIIVAQVGISGSTKLGDFVAAGGQVGFAGHLNVGAGAQVAAKSGVMRDIAPGMTVGGIPAQPIKEFWRQTALLQKLSRDSKPDRNKKP